MLTVIKDMCKKFKKLIFHVYKRHEDNDASRFITLVSNKPTKHWSYATSVTFDCGMLWK